MNYEKMSDFEINKRVAFSISKTDFEVNNFEIVRYFCDGQHLDEPEVFDPCNSPADAWPVIVENKIDTRYEGAFRHEWEVMHCIHLDEYDVEIVGPVYHKNPLRAAMICYLMMQEAK